MLAPILLGSLALLPQARSQDPDLRAQLADRLPGERWAWNDLGAARKEALRTGRPLLVLFRCVP